MWETAPADGEPSHATPRSAGEKRDAAARRPTSPVNAT